MRSDSGSRRCVPLSLLGRHLLLGLLLSGLAACDNESRVDELEQALLVGREGVTTLTISSLRDKAVFGPGDVWQLSAEGLSETREAVDVTDQVDWSSDTAGVTIDQNGLLSVDPTLANDGAVNIRATYGPFSDEFQAILSTASAESLTASADPAPVDECTSTTLLLDAVYGDGTTRPVLADRWTLNLPELGTIEGDVLTTRRQGLAVLTGVLDDLVSAPLSLGIRDALTDIAIVGDTGFAVVGGTRPLKVNGRFSDGETERDITAASSFASLVPEVARISPTGVITTLSAGTAQISASCGERTALFELTVLEPIGIRVLAPGNTLLRPGEIRQLELYELLSDNSLGSNNVADDEDVNIIWQIETGSEIATIDEFGLLTLNADISNYQQNFIRIEVDYLEFTDEIELFLERTN